jgi:integrase
VNVARAVWSIPGDRTKNGRPHEVPLPASAAQILNEAQMEVGSGCLFGEARGSFQGWSKAKAALDQRIAVAGSSLTPWRLHDLRRTVATRMADLGVQPHIIEAVLNHVSGHRAGVAGVYNRALYAAEKRRALELWSEHVRTVVERKPSNIIPIGSERAA